MLSKTSLLWLGVSTSIVLAGPMRVPVTQDDVEELMRRLPKDEKQDKIGALWDEFPACTKENDPSYATEKSKYEDKGDDYGISIGSSCDDDTWNNYWKCWYKAPTPLILSPIKISQDRLLFCRVGIRVYELGEYRIGYRLRNDK